MKGRESMIRRRGREVGVEALKGREGTMTQEMIVETEMTEETGVVDEIGEGATETDMMNRETEVVDETGEGEIGIDTMVVIEIEDAYS